MLFQLLTIVASFSPRGTIGPSGFEIITRSPYVPAAYYNYRQYNDGRLENPVRANNFRSGGDIVDYGYSAGNSMVEDKMNSLSRLDKGDVMNINFMGTEISPEAGTYKNPVDAVSIENIEFSSATEPEYKPDAFEEDFLDRTHYPPDVVASLIGG
ncbi:uncharacterized protein LOC113236850 [Hyposmocoma kahamanoa]|uniref:uncharacterized protein LOC113236850 n=1 Tax=Hyposmocoma kahamanoa TaxID=1477025 RepID=UPI000E6D5F3D|nr:uncharacterized protein LOC113236850 [Hyposmocoma kahamanoa]